MPICPQNCGREEQLSCLTYPLWSWPESPTLPWFCRWWTEWPWCFQNCNTRHPRFHNAPDWNCWSGSHLSKIGNGKRVFVFLRKRLDPAVFLRNAAELVRERINKGNKLQLLQASYIPNEKVTLSYLQAPSSRCGPSSLTAASTCTTDCAEAVRIQVQFWFLG